MNLLPTGSGTPRAVPLLGVSPTWVWFSLDASSLIVYGIEKDSSEHRFLLLPIDGGAPRALTPEGVQGQMALSPDGRFLAVAKPDGQLAAYPLAGGTPRRLPPLQAGELPLQWSDDGRSLFTGRYLRDSCDVFQVDLENGQRELWRVLMPTDRAGSFGIQSVYITSDGRAYCYDAPRRLSELHLVEGVL